MQDAGCRPQHSSYHSEFIRTENVIKCNNPENKRKEIARKCIHNDITDDVSIRCIPIFGMFQRQRIPGGYKHGLLGNTQMSLFV